MPGKQQSAACVGPAAEQGRVGPGKVDVLRELTLQEASPLRAGDSVFERVEAGSGLEKRGSFWHN